MATRMKIHAVATLAAGLLASPCTAQAQTYPDKPIKIIVPAAAGGPTDVPARLAQQILPPRLGQPIVIENRPGAGGAIGARAVATAAPDGYTLMAGNTSVLAVIPAVSASAGYDPAKDFAPVAKVSRELPDPGGARLVPGQDAEGVRRLRQEPIRASSTIAHTGAGGLPHLTGELFKARAGIDIVGVPYRSGGESVTAVLSGAVHMTFESITILLPLIRDGKLRALGVTSAQALAARARPADHGRGRRARLRGADLQRHRGARRHARRDRQQAQRRDQRGPEDAARCRTPSEAWRGRPTQHAGASSAPSSRPRMRNGRRSHKAD